MSLHLHSVFQGGAASNQHNLCCGKLFGDSFYASIKNGCIRCIDAAEHLDAAKLSGSRAVKELFSIKIGTSRTRFDLGLALQKR